jgi:hypothetical protein
MTMQDPHMAAATINHITYCHLRLGAPGPRPYGPDFHFFPTLKRTLEGRHFTINKDAEAAIWTFIRTQDTNFYQRVVQAREVMGQIHQCRWGLC